MLENKGTERDIELAARISGRYSKGREEKVLKVKYGQYGTKLENVIEVSPINDEELDKYMISVR